MDRYIPQILALDPEAELSVKEKYGTLRVDISGKKIGFDRSCDFDIEMEKESFTVCECCGAPGEIRPDLSWILTLCDRCYRCSSTERHKIEEETEHRWLELCE